ncbi:hypothetical protein FQN52_008733 [Onygenales sp. PD_12]|nr:hypothetical protein FQN52_008733 [Onygenales sp. PD_12]
MYPFSPRALIRGGLTLLLLNPVVATVTPRALGQDPVLVIDTFKHEYKNDLEAWHGGQDIPMYWGNGYVEFYPSWPNQSYYTQISNSCFDLTAFKDMYLHVVYEGNDRFSLSMSQNNVNCNPAQKPYPETWDSVVAKNYANGSDIYVPISHYTLDYTRGLSIAFHGFYTPEKLRLRKVEITATKPDEFVTPEKIPTGTLFFKCKRPNSFAFGIDDGLPEYAREVMDILASENINVTFFTVGGGLANPSTGFADIYREMASKGHQIALHTWSHPTMEGLKTDEEIDEEFVKNIDVMKELLDIESRYFRPPYGIVGARTRQRLAALIKDPYIINWGIDIQDWLWADSPTPEKQIEAFQRDVDKGGDLVVMHFLSPTTVAYTRDVIQIAKKTGKRIMRVDQCMEDPNAPPLD